MLAGPSSTISTMRKAVNRTVIALEAAAEINKDLSDEDRTFLSAEKDKLVETQQELETLHKDTETFEMEAGLRLQAKVELGDGVLDSGVRDGSAKTKAGLRGKKGLRAEHAFGKRVDDITNAPIEKEPDLVLAVVQKMEALSDFTDKAVIMTSLTDRANTQKKLLSDRAASSTTRVSLETRTTTTIQKCADALLTLQKDLDKRFLRQKKFVASFFLDVTPERKPPKKVQLLLDNIKQTGVTLSKESIKKIQKEKDPAVINRWFRMSTTLTREEDIFPPRPAVVEAKEAQ